MATGDKDYDEFQRELSSLKDAIGLTTDEVKALHYFWFIANLHADRPSIHLDNLECLCLRPQTFEHLRNARAKIDAFETTVNITTKHSLIY